MGSQSSLNSKKGSLILTFNLEDYLLEDIFKENCQILLNYYLIYKLYDKKRVSLLLIIGYFDAIITIDAYFILIS